MRMASLPMFRKSPFSLKTILKIQLCSSSAISRIKLQNKIKSNETECASQMENGKFFLFHRGKALLNSNKTEKFRKEPSLTSFEQAIEINPNLKTDSVFLRFSSEFGPLFATQVPDDVEIANIESRHNANFVDMRAAMFWVDDHRWAPILCQSHSLLNWNRKTQFCSSCGSWLTRNMSGSQRECSGCKSVHYPITSPVAIVLLTTPDHSKVLLIRQPRYPPGMFSCVAGFVDAGETLFECVQREAAEEVSVEIIPDLGIRYLNSQFWPFPSGSLMMACMAFVSEDVVPQPCMEEVEAARWFTPLELSEALERVRKNPGMRLNKDNDPDKIFVPPKGAIANYMLKTWLEKFAKK